jgi:hypothetical protein
MTREPLAVPDPQTRVSVSLYLRARDYLVQSDPDGARLLDWATELRPPATAEDLAAEIIWIILCAGRSAQAARTIEAKVWNAIRAGQPAVTAFGYKAKAAAIDRAWQEREKDFASLQEVLGTGDSKALLQWCYAIPFIGDDTQFQLAKNLGCTTCPKPDIWLCRLTGIPDNPRRHVDMRFAACLALCEYLSGASGDTVAVIDSVLWLACQKGVLHVDANAGPVGFADTLPQRRSIYAVAPSLDPA